MARWCCVPVLKCYVTCGHIIFIPSHHHSCWVLCYHVGCLWVCPSVHMDFHQTWCVVSALILLRSGLRLLWANFVSFWQTHLPVTHSCVRFRMITLVNSNGFTPKLACALILWRSGLGLLMGKFRQFLSELSAHDMSVFSFPDDNFSKYQKVFIKLGICIDSVEIWFGIANGQIL